MSSKLQLKVNKNSEKHLPVYLKFNTSCYQHSGAAFEQTYDILRLITKSSEFCLFPNN